MAIDTASKRKSISGVILPFLLVGVTPDATPGVEWRQAAGWSYNGIEPAAPSTPDVAGFSIYLRGSVNGLTYLHGSVEDTRNLTGSVNDTYYARGQV